MEKLIKCIVIEQVGFKLIERSSFANEHKWSTSGMLRIIEMSKCVNYIGKLCFDNNYEAIASITTNQSNNLSFIDSKLMSYMSKTDDTY